MPEARSAAGRFRPSRSPPTITHGRSGVCWPPGSTGISPSRFLRTNLPRPFAASSVADLPSPIAPVAYLLFPNSLDVIDRLKMWGPVAILTDGDVVFQPRKIERSGLFEAVHGNVLIYVHKE